MTRYVSLGMPATAWWDAKGSDYLARTVMEPERQPRDTGLLDASGQKLFAIEETNPIGFVWHKSHVK